MRVLQWRSLCTPSIVLPWCMWYNVFVGLHHSCICWPCSCVGISIHVYTTLACDLLQHKFDLLLRQSRCTPAVSHIIDFLKRWTPRPRLLNSCIYHLEYAIRFSTMCRAYHKVCFWTLPRDSDWSVFTTSTQELDIYSVSAMMYEYQSCRGKSNSPRAPNEYLQMLKSCRDRMAGYGLRWLNRRDNDDVGTKTRAPPSST
jgi:hypothetical protein